MLRLDRVIRPWKESGALNSQINLYGFWNEQAFLTKSGDLGMVLRVRGVDYESLDQAAQEYAVKRLEAALKTFGVGFHIYQYLFKTNRPDIPFEAYEDPVIQAAVEQRKEFFQQKLDRLYTIEIFFAIVIEGRRRASCVYAGSRFRKDLKGRDSHARGTLFPGLAKNGTVAQLTKGYFI
jgi:type IV secretion system protein VirB4